MNKSKLTWIILAGLVLLALAATAALADSPQPATEAEAPAVQPSDLNAVIGDDPDEDGYDGPVQVQSLPASGITEPAAGEAVDWESLMDGPQPDQDPYYDESNAVEGWSSFQYFFAPGTVFRPRDSDVTWNYDGVGCISKPSGPNHWFTLHLDLHEGARIDYLRLFYYDSNGTDNSDNWIVAYEADGNFDELINVESVGSPGYGTNLSPYLGHIVDNSDYGYAILWAPDALGSSLRLCGVRVAYRLPTPG